MIKDCKTCWYRSETGCGLHEVTMNGEPCSDFSLGMKLIVWHHARGEHINLQHFMIQKLPMELRVFVFDSIEDAFKTANISLGRAEMITVNFYYGEGSFEVAINGVVRGLYMCDLTEIETLVSHEFIKGFWKKDRSETEEVSK